MSRAVENTTNQRGMTMTYLTEFPDFPSADMPEIPNGYFDISWHNDTAPSFMNEAKGLRLWVNYRDPKQRECEGLERFRLEIEETQDCLLATESWEDMLAFIDA